ncbi:MAG: HD-GYP domain-containing protein [Burkholderiales bacterium]|nr:HD-GYP domain-containing protein [Burkholderiales bacterium]
MATLKKIPVAQARLGMHVHKLAGSWISHSFWRTRFRIDSADELARLRDSGAAECWIDVDLGLDVAAEPGPLPMPDPVPDPPAVPAPQPAAGAGPKAGAAAARDGPVPLEVEMREAAAIIGRGRGAVRSLFNEVRLGRTLSVEGCEGLVEEVASSVQRNAGALLSLARLKTQDDYSYMHSVAVCALMVALGRGLGLDEAGCRAAGAAGLMHDIGKALMPLEVLNKPGRLTDDEFAVMRTHPERGHALLQESGTAPASMLDVVLHHHERIDGTGYPQRLDGDRLSRLARMGAICDVYDAITSNRPYKAGWDPAVSISRMAGWKGHFDPEIFAVFVRTLGIYPIGSIVRLASGRLAIVVEQNPEQLVAPRVKVFFSTRSQLPIVPEALDLARSSDRIVGRESRDSPGARLPRLDELWADPEVLQAMKA